MPNEPTPEELHAQMVSQSKEFATTAPKVFADQDAEFANELAMLEGRTKSNIIKVPIGDGVSLSVWGSLSADAMHQYVKLSTDLQNVVKGAMRREKKATAKRTKADEEEALADAQRMDDITYDIYGLISANPAITATFLKENPDKFSPADLGKMLEGFQKAMSEGAEEATKREVATKTFRE
ncbi:MAG: hypothetical protein KAJ03_01650 [Gammaproteobacteria bacterium]|nr:hypothetical protein [Gammaproteobacteria bacterium]